MNLEEKKKLAIDNYTKAAEKAGVFDSFVLKAIEQYEEKPVVKKKKGLFGFLKK